jgi:haloalkane dehalogenase
VHYVDEGRGPTLLLLHGNPTWSFLYRHIIMRLAPLFRCVAVDYPGFGLSTAGSGYGFTPREHSLVLERLVLALDLRGVGVMVQDWGGPIGLGFAGRCPERVHSLIICNTWAWPARGSKTLEPFSKIAGGSIGRFLILNFNAFVNLLVPFSISRRLSSAEMRAYRGPFPTRASRLPTYIFPREILHSRDYLAEVESKLARLSSKPVLILWGDRDTWGTATASKRAQLDCTQMHNTTVSQLRPAGKAACAELGRKYEICTEWLLGGRLAYRQFESHPLRHLLPRQTVSAASARPSKGQ